MDVEVKKQKKKRFLRLMLSEWLSELPEDLENSWLIKLSPLGQRRLVIASKVILKKFDSLLLCTHIHSNYFFFLVQYLCI